MNYSYEKAEKSQVKVTMNFDKAEWEGAIKEAYQKNKSKFNIPGFRKGNVPFQVVVSQYGKEYFYEDALNILISKEYPEILKKEVDNIYAVGDPQFGINNIGEDGVEIFALVPVMPQFEIGAYKGIKVEKVEYNVSDEDIQKDLDRLLDRNSREIQITDRACQKGDIVSIDFSGSVDGVKFDGGSAENYRLELGSGSFIPGFEDQVIGMNIGEEKDINVKFPEDYHAELAGKDAVFAVKLHEISAKELPTLDDEFIKDATGEESVEAYKAKVRENLQKDNDKRSQNETEDKLLAAIADSTEIEIPEALITAEIDNLINQLTYRLMYQGLKFEDYLKVTGQTAESIRESYTAIAQDRVKKQLIVNKIIEVEKIVASPEEIDEKIKAQAEEVQKEYEEYRKGMDPRQIEYITNSIVVEKLFAFLISNNELVAKA